MNRLSQIVLEAKKAEVDHSKSMNNALAMFRQVLHELRTMSEIVVRVPDPDPRDGSEQFVFTRTVRENDRGYPALEQVILTHQRTKEVVAHLDENGKMQIQNAVYLFRIANHLMEPV